MLSFILLANLFFFSTILVVMTRTPNERMTINTIGLMVVLNAFGLLYSF